jgi:hypothetical protein
VVQLDLDALAMRQRGHLDPRESRGRGDQQPDGQKTQFETHVDFPSGGIRRIAWRAVPGSR